MRASRTLGLAVLLILAGADSARADGFYVGLQGGFNDVFEGDFNDDCAIICLAEAEATYEDGFIVSGAIGYGTSFGLRLEGEVTYRDNAFGPVEWTDAVRPTSGDVTSVAAMGNLYYDFGPSVVEPYIGAGLGFVNISYDDVRDANGPLFGGDETVFAWQVLAGLGFDVALGTRLQFDYRALFTESASFRYAATQRAAIAGQRLDIDYWNQSLMFGIRQEF